MDAEKLKQQKARELRYKKPIAREVNLEYIEQKLWDIQEACEEIRWYTESEDGEESLINALCGDEDEAYEFKIAFAELNIECERMFEDIQEAWIPECFDVFFALMTDGDLLGWDSYEHDYYGINDMVVFAKDEARKKLEKMKKSELIESARQCFRVYQSYVGLENRYNNLKSAIDILRNQNTGYLQTIKEIEKLYEAASEEGDFREYSEAWKIFEKYTDTLPQEAWV